MKQIKALWDINQNIFDFLFDLSPKCTWKSQAESNTPTEKQQCLLKKGHEILFPFCYAKPV